MTNLTTIKIKKASSSGELVDESSEDLKKFIEDPYFIHYLGMLSPPRPGFTDCIQLLEYTYFPPETSRNELLHMRIIDWMDITWGMVSIPISDKGRMESVAQASRLRVADGIPIILGNNEIHSFPFANERVFVLENISGHPVYERGLKNVPKDQNHD